MVNTAHPFVFILFCIFGTPEGNGRPLAFLYFSVRLNSAQVRMAECIRSEVHVTAGFFNQIGSEGTSQFMWSDFPCIVCTESIIRVFLQHSLHCTNGYSVSSLRNE